MCVVNIQIIFNKSLCSAQLMASEKFCKARTDILYLPWATNFKMLDVQQLKTFLGNQKLYGESH